MSRANLIKSLLSLVFFALLVSGCESRVLVLGNVFAMGITCLMLWSTINIKKDD